MVKIWLTPTVDILSPHGYASAKLENIRVPPSTCDSRQWWSMALFLSTQYTIVMRTTKGMGPEMLEPMDAGTALSSERFFHRIPAAQDALRVDIQAFSMMSVLVRQRSTISDIVSLESMACSFSDCSKSAGSLN